jgi:hypothetical protein
MRQRLVSFMDALAADLAVAWLACVGLSVVATSAGYAAYRLLS